LPAVFQAHGIDCLEQRYRVIGYDGSPGVAVLDARMVQILRTDRLGRNESGEKGQRCNHAHTVEHFWHHQVRT
jgi:hypothetical protein